MFITFAFTVTGCFQISTLPTNHTINELVINNNTVGNCYRECKMKAMKNNSCGNITDVLFGLQVGLVVFHFY